MVKLKIGVALGLAMASASAVAEQEKKAPAQEPPEEHLTPVRPFSNEITQPLARATPPSVLAILSHPDDEITIAPVLSRIARSGGKVTLIFATSAPDSTAKRALALTQAAIEDAKPDVIMTWGPDGGYGHSDHRMISALVTQTVAGMGTERPELLYAAFPQTDEGSLPQFESWATTHPSLMTDKIRYQDVDLSATDAALGCYESQFPAQARQGLVQLLNAREWRGIIHIRLAFATR